MPTNVDNEKNEKKPPRQSTPRKRLIIEGVTHTGETFRPSDWAERMSGKLSTFRKHRLYYSPLLHPSMYKGNKCVLLDQQLKRANPKLYQSILSFAKENNLRICGEGEGDDKKNDA